MAEIKWLIRAGEDGYLIDEFARGFVAIGWHKIGDLSTVTSPEEIRERYNSAYPDERQGRAPHDVSMIYKFCCEFEADRSDNPLTLLGLDELASLIVTHYESFDIEGRVLMPLVRVYFPAE